MSFLLSDYKWGASALGTPGGKVSVWADLTGLQYDRTTYTEEDFVVALNKAFNAWEDVASIDFEPGEENGAQIELRFAELPGNTIGQATTYFTFRDGADRIDSV
ncbi:MAG: hypothetical protein AAF330_02510, partial [Pseudomonadota bacterium]